LVRRPGLPACIVIGVWLLAEQSTERITLSVGDRRLQRQVFGKERPGDARGQCRKRAADFLRGVGLGVPHVDVAGTAGEPEEDHGFALATGRLSA
jgi:hypothetical protein